MSKMGSQSDKSLGDKIYVHGKTTYKIMLGSFSILNRRFKPANGKENCFKTVCMLTNGQLTIADTDGKKGQNQHYRPKVH